MLSEGLTLADRFQVIRQVDATTYVVQPVDEEGRELLLRAIPAHSEDQHLPVLEELRRALQITHPHVATLHAVGALDDARPFFVQDRLIDAEPLTAWATRASVAERILVCQQALSALGAYHAQGLILGGQRRIQLLVEIRQGQPHLAVTDPGGLSDEFSRSDLPLPTAATIAPERHLGVRVDRRANLYEFGAFFYQAFAGSAPGTRDGVWPPLAEVGPPDLPAEVAAWVMTLLAPRPSQRPPSAEAALAHLRRILDPGATPPPAESRPSDALLGRDAELASLLVWANSLRGPQQDPNPPHVTRGDPSLLVLRGPPGIGKRRLVDEFVTELAADGVQILRGDCAQQGQGLAGPLGPLLSQVVTRPDYGVDPDATSNATRWYVRELLGKPLGRVAASRPPRLADPQREAERTLLALGEPLLLAAVARPLLIVLDNLDQAEPLTRALTSDVARRAWVARRWAGARRALEPEGRPEPTLLILATSADGGALPRGRYVRPLDLAPLSEATLKQLAGDASTLDERDLAAGLPGTVVDPGALQAIQDVHERTVAETLAVLGRPGEFSLMAAVIGLGEAELRRALDELVRRGAVVACARQRYLLREDIAARWRSELDPDALAARARRLCVVLGERHPPVPSSAQLLERVGFALLGPAPGAHAELVRELGPSAIAHLEAISAYRQAATLCGRLAEVQPTAEAQWRAHQARALFRAGRWREALAAIEQAREVGEPSAEVEVLAAGALRALGETEAALERLERAQGAAEEDPLVSARACLAAAGIHAAGGDAGRAVAECERGLELVRSAGHAKDVAALRVRLLLVQAEASLEREEVGEAEQLTRAASALATRVDTEAVSADVFLASARVSLAGHDPGRAAASAAQAREAAAAAGDLRGEAQAAIVFARAAWKVGHAPEAREALLAGVRVAEELGDLRALAEALDALGGLCHAAGALREAAQTLRRGLLTWVELRARDRAAITSSALGAVLLDLGESQPALTHLEEALEVQREAGDRQGELETLCALIELAVRQGSYARSLALSVRARELAEEDGRAAARSRALVADATVQRALGDMPAAERLAQRALRYAARGRDTGLELRARLLVGEALARRGDYEGARRNLQRVRRAAQSVGDRANERGALLELAGVELAQHRGGHARALLDSRPVPRPGRMQPWLGKGPEGVGVLRARERLLRCRIELAREKGSLHTAIRCAEEALHEAQQATLRDLEWRARYALAATYELRREDERALGLVVEAQEIVEELMAAVPPQRAADFLAVDPTRAAALRGDSPVSALHVKMGNVSDEGLRELRAMLSLRMPTIEPARTRGPRIVEGSSASGRPLPAGTTASEFARFVSLCRDLIDEAHVERVYERLVRVAVELSEAERGFLAVFGEDADSFTAHATHGFSELGRPRERFARRCAFRAAERGQLVLSADVKVPAPVRERACLLGIGLRSVVAAPIKLPDGKRGVLFVDHAFQPERFAARHVELIEALAALGGLALGRSALEQALRERRGLDPGALQRAFLEARSAPALAGTGLPHSLHQLPSEWVLVGSSPAVGAASEALERFVSSGCSLLIAGPPGVGKGALARLAAARRSAAESLVVVDLRDVDPQGQALFGGVEPTPDRPNPFQRAAGGVLLLERLDAASPALQAKLVGVLTARTLPDGSPVATRLISVARDPDRASQAGALRPDLLALLSEARADLPALDARPEDREALLEAILGLWGDGAPELSTDALAALSRRGWPGNAREFYGVLRELALRASGRAVTAEDVPPMRGESLTAALDAYAKALIQGALAQASGDRAAARQTLGLSAEELEAWLEKAESNPEAPPLQ
ncbi:MAG: AAA family ATPase [Planctomycetes bacterium]|nr:AAA family ATPase [Planctomycetota bacterium]